MARRSGLVRVLRRSSLTGRGVVALLAGVLLVALALGTRWWALLGVGAALVLLVLLEAAVVRGDRRLVATRTVEPLVVPRGTPARCVVTAHLPAVRLPLRREAVDLVDGVSRPVPLDAPREGGPAESVYEVETPRRGLVAVGPLVVRSLAPLGLAALTREVGQVRQLRVLPRPVRLDTLPRGTRRAATGQDERVELGGTDLVGLHEYVPGDDLRRLHWASSARTGSLMVRDDADPALPHVLVLLDDRSPSYRDDDESFEEAVDFAAGLVERAVGDGRHVRLQTLSGQVDVDVPARSALVGGALDRRASHALAEVALAATPHVASVSTRDLDVVVLVTGQGIAAAEAAGVLAAAAVPVVAQVEPAPESPFGAVGSVAAVRGARAGMLAAAWDVVHG
ncbi:DUF58 domain-containing protein [Phycicoccus avicenniae]|uniref:DUF58 domain-containing protein n=1 Tax=Phycicoccus avicenniae TaxID=2828860 RepID=UPI003D273C35